MSSASKLGIYKIIHKITKKNFDSRDSYYYSLLCDMTGRLLCRMSIDNDQGFCRTEQDHKRVENQDGSDSGGIRGRDRSHGFNCESLGEFPV